MTIPAPPEGDDVEVLDPLYPIENPAAFTALIDINVDKVLADAAAASAARGAHPKMTIADEQGNVVFTAPFAPREVTWAGLSGEYGDAARPGRSPLLLRSADPRPSITFQLFVGYGDRQRDVEFGLNALRNIAAQQSRVRVSYGPSESSILWRITSFGFSSIDRQFGTNAITRATADLTLTQAVDIKVNRGPVSGGARPPAGAPAATPKPGTPTRGRPVTVKTHVVVKGDTLAKIANVHYRDPNKWKIIATANKISDPKTLQIGKRLTIPALR